MAESRTKQMFVATGYYKGQVVAIKPINNQKKIEVNRQLMKEMKKVCRFFAPLISLKISYFTTF